MLTRFLKAQTFCKKSAAARAQLRRALQKLNFMQHRTLFAPRAIQRKGRKATSCRSALYT